MRVGAVLFAVLVAAASGAQAASGERLGPSIQPIPKAGTGSITFTDFFGGTCSDAGFTVTATARINIVGLFDLQGTTTLDGVPFDTYGFTESGPDQYLTTFKRDFTPPPPASPNYVFVFSADVLQGGTLLGRSRTTITCQASVLQAQSIWLPAGAAVPVGGPAGLALLVALLGLAAVARLRKPLA